MTLTTTASRVTNYPGTGITGPFAFPFRILSDADLLVTKRVVATGVETTLTLTTHYTVSGALEATGSVTLVTALAVGEELSIRRKPALTQPTSVENQGEYFAQTHERAFDRLEMQLQSLQDAIDRSPKLSESYDPAGYSMAGLVPRANQVVAFNASNTGIESRSVSDSATTLPGDGRTVSTLTDYLAHNAVYNPEDYGPAWTTTVDYAAAINTAITRAAASHGLVGLLRPEYRALSPIVGADSVTIMGTGGIGNNAELTAQGACRIHGKHTGVAVLDMRATSSMKVVGFGVYGDDTTTPKTGVALGRPAGLASAGNHRFEDFQVSGSFTKACLYSIASESNRYRSIQLILNGGGAKDVFYTGQSDGLGVGGTFGGGSNIDTYFDGFVFASYVDDPLCSLIYIDGGANTKSLAFIKGFLMGTDGNYVKIRLWETDNLDTPGPITFLDVSGERISGTKMQYGFNITSTAASAVSGISIINCVLPTTALGKFINQSANATIKDSEVRCPANLRVSSWVVANLSNVRINEGFGEFFYGKQVNYGSVEYPSVALVMVNGANQNFVLPEGRNFHITGPTGAFNTGGFTGGRDGRVVVVTVGVGFVWTLNYHDAGSAGANQISIVGGANRAVGGIYATVTLRYDAALEGRWWLVSSA